MAKPICSPRPEAKALLDKLLDEAHRKYDIVYRGYLANHLSHAICSLYSLGGTSSQLQAHYDMYVKRLEPLRKPEFEVNESNWKSYIANNGAYPELLSFFDKQISELGIKQCILKYLPQLIPGLHSAAFHPLIHIGYGIEYDSAPVLSEGLAYACIEYRSSGELIDNLPETKSPQSSIVQIVSEFQSLGLVKTKDITGRFAFEYLLTTHGDALKTLLIKWRSCEDETKQMACLDELTHAAILAFFGSYRKNTLDFFLAHGLTGIHAVRQIFPLLPAQQKTRLLRIFLVAFFGAYWHQGAPTFNEDVIMKFKVGDGPKEINWVKFLQQTLECEEEHVIKVVRALAVLKDAAPPCTQMSDNGHPLWDNCAYLIVNTIKDEDDYNFDGIGFLN